MELHLPNRLWHFHGGLHPEQQKGTTRDESIRTSALPGKLILPLQQHIGAEAETCVQVGDTVYKGQTIATATGYVSAALHAPTSGTITGIEDHPLPHPSGLSGSCIIIEPDGKDEWWPEKPAPVDDYLALDPAEIRQRVRDAGIVGLGGAAFPTAVKLNPPSRHHIDTLIINGAECEPYITCDDRLMRERADEVIEGVRIIRQALGIARVVIGVEDNKLEACAAIEQLIKDKKLKDIELTRVPTIYPTGGEKQLIKVLTGREVPSNGLPADIGVVCHNVGTAASVYRALAHGEPMISRIMTVTGGGVHEPCNLDALIGTPINHLVAQAEGYTDQAERLIMGGPMMGFALGSDDIPVIKGTNCILVAQSSEVETPVQPMPCIRCGRCTSVCPANLLPQEMYWNARSRDFDKIQDYNLFDCIECGCCAAVCPSHIPLVQYYRFAKTEIWALERAKDKSDHARERHEFRLERIEREKQEKAERLAKKKAALAAKKSKDGTAKVEDSKKAAIEAALERAKAKKTQSNVKPKNIEDLTEAQQRQIDDAEARRKASSSDKASKEEAPEP
jgi:electron transport complex protein RnfC